MADLPEGRRLLSGPSWPLSQGTGCQGQDDGNTELYSREVS